MSSNAREPFPLIHFKVKIKKCNEILFYSMHQQLQENSCKPYGAKKVFALFITKKGV